MKTLNTNLRGSARYVISYNKIYYGYTRRRRCNCKRDGIRCILMITNLLLLLSVGMLLSMVVDYSEASKHYKKETVVVSESITSIRSNSKKLSTPKNTSSGNISYEVKTLVADPAKIVSNQLGQDTIKFTSYELTKHELPSAYYTNLDYSSFQPYMSYKMITNKSSNAYKVTYSKNAYTDENGFRRYKTTDDQFTIDGHDDYIVALGTFYKEKGTAGDRYLIVTTTGMYTIITGDEKSDNDTDSMNMFTTHSNGKAGLIEWIVDTNSLCDEIKLKGTVTAGPVIAMQGEIIGIYEINNFKSTDNITYVKSNDLNEYASLCFK